MLTALSNYLAVSRQKILCGHSCVPKHRIRESSTDKQQAFGVAMGSECCPGGVQMGTAPANPGSTMAEGGMLCLLVEMLGKHILISPVAFWAVKGIQSQGKLISFASSKNKQKVGNSIQVTLDFIASEGLCRTGSGTHRPEGYCEGCAVFEGCPLLQPQV